MIILNRISLSKVNCRKDRRVLIWTELGLINTLRILLDQNKELQATLSTWPSLILKRYQTEWISSWCGILLVHVIIFTREITRQIINRYMYIDWLCIQKALVDKLEPLSIKKGKAWVRQPSSYDQFYLFWYSTLLWGSRPQKTKGEECNGGLESDSRTLTLQMIYLYRA